MPTATPKLSIGDTVRYLDEQHQGIGLVQGGVYTVTNTNRDPFGNMLISVLPNQVCTTLATRFELVSYHNSSAEDIMSTFVS